MSKHSFRPLNQPIDISCEFSKMENTYFNAASVDDFNPDDASGTIRCTRYSRKVRMAFGQMVLPFEETKAWEFPAEYGQDYSCPFSINFISQRTIRIRFDARRKRKCEESSIMLCCEPGIDTSWEREDRENATAYKGEYGSVTLTHNPFHIEIRDSSGRLLTSTEHFGDTKSIHTADNIPFSFVRRNEDLKRFIAASFSLSPDEKIYGCGESFTRLNKRGQKIILWTTGNHGGQTQEMYKPVPFFMSSRGYGMFVHSSAPMTFDFGNSYDQYSTLFLGEDHLDLFVFLGSPKEILSEYTALTGRSPVPPLWSFGLWMSRITYKSEGEIREVAAKLREHRIPCDVINIDTGWFEKDWRCDYKFSQSRFEDPEKMLKELKEQGFHTCLWQLPYFTPTNPLYKVMLDKGYAVLDTEGDVAGEDAVLDFSNPDAVRWYKGLLEELLKMGVASIKVDFGEAGPVNGVYASGKSGIHEHNLYPLRYNKAAAEITKEVSGEDIIWARSAWAGSQRYPLHWSGDIENTDCGMAATLRSGLSLGLCGFTYWSHDIGGFVKKTPEELYRRWLPFGMLTSHSRCHGQPPKEPWYFSNEFLAEFRRIVEMKYKLMPYIYAQAVESSQKGFPMLRTLFFEFPEDPGAWLIEDEYMFGSDLLVAPLMEENRKDRDVYLPTGTWVDYQTGKVYEGGRWYRISSDEVPVIILVKDGAAIPHVDVAQSTGEIDWSNIQQKIYTTQKK